MESIITHTMQCYATIRNEDESLRKTSKALNKQSESENPYINFKTVLFLTHNYVHINISMDKQMKDRLRIDAGT